MKKILLFLACFTLIFSFTGCNTADEDLAYPIDFDLNEGTFPINEYGLPKENLTVINGQLYSLEKINSSVPDEAVHSVIEIELDKNCKKIEVSLPRQGCSSQWSVNRRILAYTTQQLNSKPNGELKIGLSNTVEHFMFKVSEVKGKSIIFKTHNAESEGKPFSEIQANYILELKIK